MKQTVMLTTASLLTILFMTFHLSDEIARGMERGGLNMVIPVFVLVVWLYGTLVLAGRRSGYIIMLVASIVGTGVPILHMAGKGLAGGRIAPNSSGAFFWVWQNFTLCVISLFTLILSVRGLWNLHGAGPGSPTIRTCKGPSQFICLVGSSTSACVPCFLLAMDPCLNPILVSPNPNP
jgi:hypothetical protein